MNIQIRSTVIKFAVLLGALLWIMDGVLDYFFFMEGSFLGLTFTNIPSHELYIRLFWFGGLLVIGLFASRIINDKESALADKREMEKFLRQSEEKFREIFNNAADAIYFQRVTEDGQAGKFIEVNQRACEMLGYSREELLSMTPADIDEGRSEKVSEITEEITSKKQMTFETVYISKDGTRIPVEINAHFFKLDGGNRALTIARDITKRKQAEQALQEQGNKLKKLHEAVDQFQQCETEEELLDVAVRATKNILDFDHCAFYRLEGDRLIPSACTQEVELEELPTHQLDDSLAGRTYREKRSILGDDLRKEEMALEEGSELRGYLSVPIGEVGVFQAASSEVGAFGEEDRELAEILAGHLQEEIKRIRLEDELREQAIHDPLTDLYNRRYFNETLKKEVQEVKRYGKPLAFLMIDINRFKEINDTYSHQVGDEVLNEVADLLKENLRDADTVVRYGGDEFLVMMPETEKEAREAIDRLDKALDRWNDQNELIDFPLDLAIGVSHWNSDQDRDVEEALKEADKKMYEDKNR